MKLKKIMNKAKEGLVALLVPTMLGVAGCSREAPKKSEFAITYTYVPYREPCSMWDENGDEKIDAIRDKQSYVAVDTNIIKNYLKLGGNPIVMDSNMVELATKITNLERELGYKIDSTQYSIHKSKRRLN